MKAEVKVQWIAALRGGEYKQGQNYLTRGDRHCCLGVLCQLAVKAGVPVEVQGETALSYDGGLYSLPLSVADWAGLDGDTSPIVPFAGVEYELASLNDGFYGSAPMTFEQIADLIEEHL
jgi:hypothetical protein